MERRSSGWTGRCGEVMPNQGAGAEMMATRWGLSRSQLDEYSLASHEKAAAAQDAGLFDSQIAAVPAEVTGAEPVSVDEGVRRGGTVAGMGSLRPAFAQDGVVTAGNASQISDGRLAAETCAFLDA